MNTVPERLAAGLADRYRIERELGAGGMGTVYLAEDLKHNRKVAVKVLHPELAAVLGAERFLAEIQTTANLQHPHILPLHDSGQADGLLFYVMPNVEGETLRARLTREQQLPIDDAARITKEVASALDYAHRHGVIHRDIKPENILLHEGQALIADFGIALAVSTAGVQRMTQTGMSLGTPEYMSPEQALGERAITVKSDVYALGCVLYEMLTGEPPFTGATVQAIVAKVTHERPVPPSSIRDTVPSQVEAAVLRALAKVPADRFATAAEFAEALTHPPIGAQHAHSGSVRGSFRERPSHLRLVVVVAALGWTAVAALMFANGGARASVGQSDGLRVAVALPDSAPILLDDESQSRVAISRDGKTIVYDARLSDGRAALYRITLDDFDAHRIPGSEGGARRTFFLAPDGRSVALVEACAPGCTVRRLNLDGSGGTTLASNVAEPNTGTWTIDSAIVSAARDWTEVIVIPTKGGAVRRMAPPNFNIDAPELLPDGKFVVATLVPLWQGAPARWHGLAQVIGVMSLADGTPFALTLRGLVRADSAAESDWLIGASPRLIGGNRLLFTRNDGSVMTVGFDAAKKRLTSSPSVVLNGVAMASLGQPLIDVGTDGTLVFAPGPNASATRLAWATPDSRLDTLKTVPAALYYSYTVSPDGSRVAVIVQPTASAAELRVYDTRSGATERQTDDAQWDVIWSRDGEWISYGTGRGKIMRRRAGRLAEADSMAFGGTVLDMTPDGSLVSVGRFGPVVRPGLWVVPWGKPDSAILIDSSMTSGCGQFSPDRRAIFYKSAAEGSYASYLAPIGNPIARRQVAASTDCGRWDAIGIRGARATTLMSRSGSEWTVGALRPVTGYARSSDLFGFDHVLYVGERRIQMIGPRPEPITRLYVAREWVQALNRSSATGRARGDAARPAP